MSKTIIASKNEGKIREIKEILAISGLELVSFHEVGGWEDVPENGESFYENAVIKAKALVQRFGIAAIADDSGLEVDALGGAPGVRSARFAGENSGDKLNNEKLLSELEGVDESERTARFRCAAVYLDERGTLVAAEGALEGRIGFEPSGSSGFGYDPLFIPEGYDTTLAELGSEVKNAISHRGKAFLRLKIELDRVIGE